MTMTSNEVTGAGVASPVRLSPARLHPARLHPAGLSPAGLSPARLTPRQLGRIVAAIAGQPRAWRPVVRFREEHRWYARLDPASPDAPYEVWLLSWLPGQQTGFHDHGDAAGAFAVAAGELQEVTAAPGHGAVRGRDLAAGAVRSFGPAYIHDVRNLAAGPAVSVHAYSPPLSAMRRYELTAAGLCPAAQEVADESWQDARSGYDATGRRGSRPRT